ncbi:MAG TPA: hypothetical protein PKN75_08980 [Bacteroidia bacterium]|nr:hypothetical protein [Bacteroidia bacterium]HNU33714.1 hypothetical protein [Bacteroidia bacterium]
MNKKILCICLMVFMSCFVFAQALVKDTAIGFPFFGIGMAVHLPGADMADRFGTNAAVHSNFSYKFKSGFTLTTNGGFLFGTQINEGNILKNISTSDGEIIGNDGRISQIRLFERGYFACIDAGKIFSSKKPNPNSGIWVTMGAGFIQHKIRIENIGNAVYGLDKDYVKGYDRLTNGLMLHQFVGYVYFGNKRLINFFAGVEGIQGFTQNRRSYNFDTMIADDKKRFDLLIGIKAGWILPLYTKPDKFYYN